MDASNRSPARTREPRGTPRSAAGALPPEVRTLAIVVAFSAGYTALIWALSGRLAAVPLLPDAGASWYYWQLPEPTVWSRASAWGLYLLHQLFAWGAILWAQTRVARWSVELRPFNWAILGGHAAFVLLHVLQTHLFYDGLAQDVSIWSSQGSVIVLLVWVLLLENRRRGLFFGQRIPLGARVRDAARRYHGYFFAWAVVYTFWYHPTVATSGHLWGFFYTVLLIMQGGLLYNRAHTNRWWTFFLEFTVLVHGTLVAVGQGNGIWPMFFFGFGGIFVITQMHGLGLSRAVRAGLAALYVALVLWVYNGDWGSLDEIVRIPVIEYLAVLLLAGLLAGGAALAARLRGPATPSASD